MLGLLWGFVFGAGVGAFASFIIWGTADKAGKYPIVDGKTQDESNQIHRSRNKLISIIGGTICGVALLCLILILTPEKQSGLTNPRINPSTGYPDVHVRGYYRRDGTYVSPHIRSYPDGDPTNNYGRR